MTQLWFLVIFRFFSVCLQINYEPFCCVLRSPTFLERNLRGFWEAEWGLLELWGNLRWRWEWARAQADTPPSARLLGSDLTGVFRVLVKCMRPKDSISELLEQMGFHSLCFSCTCAYSECSHGFWLSLSMTFLLPELWVCLLLDTWTVNYTFQAVDVSLFLSFMS